jgi:uncharacterized protein
MSEDVVGRVAEIWRHPVKSLQGEPRRQADVDRDGLRGDRLWGIRDETTGRILTGRREPQLLGAAASLAGDGEPVVTLPDGSPLHGLGVATDKALSEWLGRAVTLVAAEDVSDGRAEYFKDATDDTSQALEWTMPAGRFVDSKPLLLLTTASLRAGAARHPDGTWDVRRFRPNVLIEVEREGWVEDAWCGQTVLIGDAVVTPLQPCSRCTMVTRPQPGLERDLEVFKTLAREHDAAFGVWTGVRTPGVIQTGDPVRLVT